MALSFASLSASPPVASLSLDAGIGGIRRISLGVSKPPAQAAGARSSSLLHTSFLSCASTSLSLPSSCYGLSLGIDLGSSNVIRSRRRGLQVRAGKAVLCMTKRSRSRKSLLSHSWLPQENENHYWKSRLEAET